MIPALKPPQGCTQEPQGGQCPRDGNAVIIWDDDHPALRLVIPAGSLGDIKYTDLLMRYEVAGLRRIQPAELARPGRPRRDDRLLPDRPDVALQQISYNLESAHSRSFIKLYQALTRILTGRTVQWPPGSESLIL